MNLFYLPFLPYLHISTYTRRLSAPCISVPSLVTSLSLLSFYFDWSTKAWPFSLWDNICIQHFLVALRSRLCLGSWIRGSGLSWLGKYDGTVSQRWECWQLLVTQPSKACLQWAIPPAVPPAITHPPKIAATWRQVFQHPGLCGPFLIHKLTWSFSV